MKKATSFRLSPESMKILEVLAKRYSISKTAILELIIREKATKEGIKWISNAQDLTAQRRRRAREAREKE